MPPETTSLQSDTTLILKRTVAAPRPKVFEAWTNPKVLTQWFFPTDDYVSPLVEVDLRVGGRYRLVIRHIAKGIEHVMTGVYKEIQPPSRLVFTWTWEGEKGNEETEVTVELRDLGSSTEIVLKHEYFQTKDSRDRHEEGWKGCIKHLVTLSQH